MDEVKTRITGLLSRSKEARQLFSGLQYARAFWGVLVRYAGQLVEEEFPELSADERTDITRRFADAARITGEEQVCSQDVDVMQLCSSVPTTILAAMINYGDRLETKCRGEELVTREENKRTQLDFNFTWHEISLSPRSTRSALIHCDSRESSSVFCWSAAKFFFTSRDFSGKSAVIFLPDYTGPVVKESGLLIVPASEWVGEFCSRRSASKVCSMVADKLLGEIPSVVFVDLCPQASAGCAGTPVMSLGRIGREFGMHFDSVVIGTCLASNPAESSQVKLHTGQGFYYSDKLLLKEEDHGYFQETIKKERFDILLRDINFGGKPSQAGH